MSTAKTITKDKPFAASLAVVTVAILASQGIELENEVVQTAVETALAALAGIAALVAAVRAAVLKVRYTKHRRLCELVERGPKP